MIVFSKSRAKDLEILPPERFRPLPLSEKEYERVLSLKKKGQSVRVNRSQQSKITG